MECHGDDQIPRGVSLHTPGGIVGCRHGASRRDRRRSDQAPAPRRGPGSRRAADAHRRPRLPRRRDPDLGGQQGARAGRASCSWRPGSRGASRTRSARRPRATTSATSRRCSPSWPDPAAGLDQTPLDRLTPARPTRKPAMTVLTLLAGDTTPRPAGSRRDGLLAGSAALSARPRRVLLIWALVVLVAAPLAVTLTSALSGAGWEAQGSTAAAGPRRAAPRLPAARRRGGDRRLPAGRRRSPMTRPASATLVAGLQGSPGTDSVVDPLAATRRGRADQPDGRAALVPVGLVGRRATPTCPSRPAR